MTNEGYQPKTPKSAPIPPRGEGGTIRISTKNIIGGGGAGARVARKVQARSSDTLALCIAIALCFFLGFALGVAFSG